MASSSSIRAGRAYVELSTKDAGLQRGLKNAARRLKSIGAGIARVGAITLAAGAAASSAFLLATKTFTTFGDQLDKMSARTGVSVETLSALDFAAQRSGASIEDVEKGIRTLQVSIRNGTRGLETYTDAFDELGLSADQLAQMSPEEQFAAVADALASIDDPSRRAALAVQLLGRAGTRLLPLLNNGASGIEAFKKEAQDLGLVIDRETATAAAQLTDALGDLKAQGRAIAIVIGSTIGPALTGAIRIINPIVSSVIEWIKANKGLVRTVALVVAITTALGAALVGLGLAIVVIGIAVGGLATALSVAGALLGAIGSVILAIASPIGLVVGAVVALGAVVIKELSRSERAVAIFSAAFAGLKATIGPIIQGIVDALKGGNLTLAAKIGAKGIELVWTQLTSSLKSLWVDVEIFILRSVNKVLTAAKAGSTRAVGLVAGAIGDLLDIPVLTGISNAARVSAQAIEREGDALKGVIDQIEESRRDGIGEDLEKLRRELEQLIMKASEERKANEQRQAERNEEIGAGLGGQITSRLSSGQAFSALGGRAFAGENLQARIANASEETVREVRRVRQNQESNTGAVFV